MNAMAWNGLDWVILRVGLIGVARGLWRGAISQVFGIVGALGGFLLAAHFFEGGAALLKASFSNFPQPDMASFLIIFVLTWFVMGGLGFWLSGLMRRTGLGFLDRTLGAGVGLGKALVLTVILISALTFLLPSRPPILANSFLAPHVQESTRFLMKVTPSPLQETFNRKCEDLKRYWSGREKTGSNAHHRFK